jgi:hypothetical protein
LFSPYKIINAETPLLAGDFYAHQACMLDAAHTYRTVEGCYPSDFAMKMFLHLLYVKPLCFHF